jgi:hypothetical protein
VKGFLADILQLNRGIPVQDRTFELRKSMKIHLECYDYHGEDFMKMRGTGYETYSRI